VGSWLERYPNAPYAYEYELAEGFTPAQAAGIVGNLIQESGVNPESVQPDGPGRGIAQWSQGGRWNPALMTGNPSTDLPNQLAFIMSELQQHPGSYPGGYGLNDLKNAQTPEQAAQIFGTDFERYGIAGARVKDARSVYDALSVGGAPLSSVPASSVPTAQLTDFGPGNILGGPLGWATGAAESIVGLGKGLSGIEKLASDIGTFVGVALYGGTWIRFGEAILGVIVLAGGIIMLVGALASSPGTLTALGSVAALFPGEGTAASLAAKTAAGARAAGGRSTGLSKFAAGAQAEAGRQEGARRARAQSEHRRGQEAHRSYQRSQTSYRRSLNLYEQAKERDARAEEDAETHRRSEGAARSNRTGYRRHLQGGREHRHDKGPIFG
jgi:hypothetical protein